VNLFEFGLRLGPADAVDIFFVREMIALKFLDGGFECVGVGAVELASEISEIIEAADLAGDFVNGI
jgi:hypothetical protein